MTYNIDLILCDFFIYNRLSESQINSLSKKMFCDELEKINWESTYTTRILDDCVLLKSLKHDMTAFRDGCNKTWIVSNKDWQKIKMLAGHFRCLHPQMEASQ